MELTEARMPGDEDRGPTVTIPPAGMKGEEGWGPPAESRWGSRLTILWGAT